MSDEKRRGGTATKMLMPVVATVASAVASYVAKKAPQYLEETVLPKLRETKDSAGGVGDVAHDLADRARSVVGGGDANGDGGSSRKSNDELERRRRERAEHRSARRKAS
jgi:hypothetical protein